MKKMSHATLMLILFLGVITTTHAQSIVFQETLYVAKPAGWDDYEVSYISTASRLTTTDSWLATPSYNLSGWTSLVLTYEFGRYLNGGATLVDVQISTDGINWTAATITSSPPAAASSTSWTSVTVDISSAITPTATTRIRWASVHGGIRLRNVKLEGISTDPTISVTPNTLSGFTYLQGSGPSTEQSFSVSGVNLNDNIVITPTSNYEISTTSGTGFSSTNPITLTQTAGSVNPTTVFVRLKETLLQGAYNNDSITLTSTGATNKAVVCNGSVTVLTPIITMSPSSLTGFTYIEGSGPSPEQVFTVAGNNLTDVITVTPPTFYEISTTAGAGFVATNPITLSPVSGDVNPTNVYVRLKASLTYGTYNNEVIIASSPGAANKTLTLSGNVTVSNLPEPANHVTNFAATVQSNTSISLSWTDEPTASGYLIRMSTVSYAAINAPVDGAPVANGNNNQNINQGNQSFTWTGLTPQTTYYFKIYPYANSGSLIDYKTDGNVPQAFETTTTVGIDFSASSKDVTVFPNPARNFIYVQADLLGSFSVQVFDILGKTVAAHENMTNGSISTANLESGLYFVRITGSAGWVQTQKIIIE
jgi:hypothetical protein